MVIEMNEYEVKYLDDDVDETLFLSFTSEEKDINCKLLFECIKIIGDKTKLLSIKKVM